MPFTRNLSVIATSVSRTVVLIRVLRDREQTSIPFTVLVIPMSLVPLAKSGSLAFLDTLEVVIITTTPSDVLRTQLMVLSPR